MTGGVAQSVDAGIQINNVTPVVIGGSLTTGSIGNAGMDQSVSSKAEGGNFGLSMALFQLQNLERRQESLADFLEANFGPRTANPRPYSIPYVRADTPDTWQKPYSSL